MMTHIIFSSTIPIKYDILDQLYELTNDNVVVAMRYGNGIKSLFNYPSQKTDDKHWYCVSQQDLIKYLICPLSQSFC